MSKLIDIDDERFWDILFDEACVEGNQAERIKTELDKIVAFDTEKVVEEVKKLDLDGVSMVEDGKYTLVRRNEVISLIQTNGVCNVRQKSCKYCYKKDSPLSTEKTLSDKWSDIVKKGGAE